MRTIIILRGLPASGKSTWARDLLRREPNRWKRINRDDLRSMLDDGAYSHPNESFIRSVQRELIAAALRDGFDVVVDDTNLVPKTVKGFYKLAESIGDVRVVEKCFDETIETCLERNRCRDGRARVSDDVIAGMARRAGLDRGTRLVDSEVAFPPRASTSKEIVQDESLPKAIICDIDGTLAVVGDRSPYDAKECDVKDRPNVPVVQAVLAMHARGYRVVFVSGRTDDCREQTMRFIERHVQEEYFNPHSDPKSIMEPIQYELHMRKTGDSRKDAVVKRELFDEHIRGRYNVVFALDDRNQVVDQFRSMGLTVFQVNYGNF